MDLKTQSSLITHLSAPLKIAEYNLLFEFVDYQHTEDIISAEQEIPELGAKCLLELAPYYYDEFFEKNFTKCIVSIKGLCEEFQLSGKYKTRLVCVVGGENVFDQEIAITSSSIKTENYSMDVSNVSAKGSLMVDVKVELYGTGLDLTAFLNPVKNYKALAENIGKMLQSSQFSDFVFIVQSQEFKVHRNILAQASPVFTALFASDMEEAKSKKCVIEHIEPNIFGHLLNYTYKFELPLDLTSASKKLYEAADYYEISKLKDICLLRVSSTLTVVNALELFYWSDHYDENLKVKAWEIIKRDLLKIFLPLKLEPPSAILLKQMLEINKTHAEFWETQIAK